MENNIVGKIEFIVDTTSEEMVQIGLRNTETGEQIGIYDERVSGEGSYKTKVGIPADNLIKGLTEISVIEED